MSEDIEDKMQQIYEQFRSDLASGTADLYYDEMELLDVFDYAGDVHDDYIRTETLLLAARLFPNSDEFAKRRAIFLSSINDTALTSFISDRIVDLSDPIWAILQCRAINPRDEHACTMLHNIAELGFDTDESIIQYVSLVKYLNQEQWLIDNLDFVRKQCEYENTLLFEIARLANTNPQCNAAIKLLEELTMSEPFNINYWGVLAELQANTGRYSDALSSIDYMKAITPNDAETLAMEGYVKLRMEKPFEAAVSFEAALTIDPKMYVAKRNLLQAYKSTGNTTKYMALLPEVYEATPMDTAVVVEYISAYPDRIEQVMPRYYADNDPDEMQICQIAGEMCNSGYKEAAMRLMTWFRDNYSLTQFGSFNLIEVLYLNHEYKEAYSYFQEFAITDEIAVKPHDLPIIGILASILVHIGQYSNAYEFCQIWLKHLTDPTMNERCNKLVLRGLIKTLNDISEITYPERTSSPTAEEIANATL